MDDLLVFNPHIVQTLPSLSGVPRITENSRAEQIVNYSLDHIVDLQADDFHN